jgi:DNA-binding CsgD family transcriptional regulator
VTWLLEANEQPPAELVLRAAGEALAKSDAALAERLMRSAEIPRGTQALVLLGTALSVQGRAIEARRALDEASVLVASDPERSAAALAMARHLVWMEREFEAGVGVLSAAIDAVADRAARAELRAELAICLAVAGDAEATIRLTDEVLAEPAASPRAVLSALVQSTLARTILGRYNGLAADLDRADALASELRTELPLAVDQLGVTRALGLHFVDLAAAAAAATTGWRRATDEGGVAAIWSNALAFIEVDRGAISRAVAAARQGMLEVRVFDPFRNDQVMLSTLALGLALQGQVDEAAQCADLAGALDGMEPRTRAYADRALAWRSAADPARATEVALAGGERAVAGSHVTWGSLLFHDAVRLGRPELAVEPLERLARESSAPLIDVMARHANAAAARDASRLADVGAEFLVRGSPLFAAEAYAEAATYETTEPARSRWLAAGAHLAAFCDGASTPPLANLASPLTEREREVASLAAAGIANREIGAHLYLSVRTVENHLASAYRKLGLSGRHELTEILRPDPLYGTEARSRPVVAETAI